MKRLAISKAVFKALTPEQQAGLQNIGALIDQMLQSGQAEVQQQPQPPKAPPKPAPAQGAQPPAGVAALKDLEGDQKKTRIGGVSQNEGESMGRTRNPKEESEDETERAPNVGDKMERVSKADLGQSESDGYRGRGIVGHQEAPLLNEENDLPPKKQGAKFHPGTDGSTVAEDRIEDIPVFDEEGAESLNTFDEGNEDGEDPGEANPKTTANKELQLLRTIARALNIREARPVRKSQDSDAMAEVREVRKAVEYLIMKLDPVGARAAGIMGSVEKELDPRRPRPVYRNDETDDKTTRVLKALLEEVQGDRVRKDFGSQGEGISEVRKALREEGLPVLRGLAGELWGTNR